MRVAIDPDLFAAAIADRSNEQALIEFIYAKRDIYEYIVDKPKKLLEQEYADLANNAPDQKAIAIQLLMDVFIWNRERVRHYPAEISNSNFQALLKNLLLKCNDQNPIDIIELTLLGIALAASRRELKILLCAPPGIRSRKLFEPDFCSGVCKHLKNKLRVIRADEQTIKYDGLEAKPQKSDRDRLYEKMAAGIIGEFYQCPHFYLHTPSEVAKRLAGAPGDKPDIDIYGYDHSCNPVKIWIGECKYYRDQTDCSVESGKLRQLMKRIPVVQEHEKSKNERPVTVSSFVISNGRKMEPNAWKLASEIMQKGHAFKFISTRMNNESPRHKNREDIKIVEVEEYEPELEGSNWKGRLIRRFSTDRY